MDRLAWHLCTDDTSLCYFSVSNPSAFESSITDGSFSVMNVVTDIMILSLPIKYVVRLQMKRAKKIQVLTAFALGGM